MKIYTRKGDDGRTSLFGGTRTGKDDLRVEAYGTVDELNSALGVTVAYLDREGGVAEDLVRVQHHLFRLGAVLADPGGKAKNNRPLGDAEIHALEQAIDAYEDKLPALKAFILPGGAPGGAFLHGARSIARRAERAVVHLASSGEDVPSHAISYLNRLSDFLFVLARVANQAAGVAEEEWDPEV